jgi:hypothetical protein
MGIPQYPFPKRIGILTMNDIDAAAKDFCKPIFKGVSPKFRLIRSVVTVVKVLHFIDGVKLYVWTFLREIRGGLPHAMGYVVSCYCISNLDFDWKLVCRKPSPTWPGIVRAGLEKRLVG